jgi:hypothetical protein
MTGTSGPEPPETPKPTTPASAPKPAIAPPPMQTFQKGDPPGTLRKA